MLAVACCAVVALPAFSQWNGKVVTEQPFVCDQVGNSAVSAQYVNDGPRRLVLNLQSQANSVHTQGAGAVFQNFIIDNQSNKTDFIVKVKGDKEFFKKAGIRYGGPYRRSPDYIGSYYLPFVTMTDLGEQNGWTELRFSTYQAFAFIKNVAIVGYGGTAYSGEVSDVHPVGSEPAKTKVLKVLDTCVPLDNRDIN